MAVTAVASVKTTPAPPDAKDPRCTRCQSSASPSWLEYWHMGETPIRLRASTSRNLRGENSVGISDPSESSKYYRSSDPFTCQAFRSDTNRCGYISIFTGAVPHKDDPTGGAARRPSVEAARVMGGSGQCVPLPDTKGRDMESHPLFKTKREIRALLREGDLDAVARLAERRRRVLGDLVPLTYHPDACIAWRAVEAMGLAAARISDDDPDAVREQLRRLFWLITEESGAICWRAPEAMAEIVRHRPGLFGEYVPIVMHLLLEMAEEDLAHFRPGVLWAIGSLGTLAAAHLDEVLPAIVAALDDSDAQARGMAILALERVGRGDLLAGREALLDDDGAVELYEGGTPRRSSVGELTRRALGVAAGG